MEQCYYNEYYSSNTFQGGMDFFSICFVSHHPAAAADSLFMSVFFFRFSIIENTSCVHSAWMKSMPSSVPFLFEHRIILSTLPVTEKTCTIY